MKHSLFLCLLLKFARKMFILHFFVATLLQKWHFSMKSTEKSLMGGQFCKIYPPMRHASSSSPPEWIWEKLTLCSVEIDILNYLSPKCHWFDLWYTSWCTWLYGWGLSYFEVCFVSYIPVCWFWIVYYLSKKTCQKAVFF